MPPETQYDQLKKLERSVARSRKIIPLFIIAALLVLLVLLPLFLYYYL